jgi:hypothetical protein
MTHRVFPRIQERGVKCRCPIRHQANPPAAENANILTSGSSNAAATVFGWETNGSMAGDKLRRLGEAP